MEDRNVFETLSCCFAPEDEAAWQAVTEPAAWDGFLRAVRRLLQDDRSLGESQRPVWGFVSARPLQEFLTESEIDALFTPPTFTELDALPKTPETDEVARALETVAELLKQGRRDEAQRYLIQAFDWLTELRAGLLDANGHPFRLAIVDVVLGIREQQSQVLAA